MVDRGVLDRVLPKVSGTKGAKDAKGQKVPRVPWFKRFKRCQGFLGQKLRRSTWGQGFLKNSFQIEHDS